MFRMASDRQRPLGSGSSLPAFRLFRDLDPAAREEITACATRVRRGRGERLFRQGGVAHFFYFLQEGRVKITWLTRDGQLVLLRFIVPGEAFGCIAALGNSTYPVSAEAAEECLVLAWNGRTMDRLLRRHPQLAMNLIDLLAERLHDMQARYEQLATEQVEQRLARILLRLVDRTGRCVEGGILVDVRLARHDLAAMAGASLFTVSRILKRWQEAGVIQSKRQRILVRHPHGLVSIAEGPPSADAALAGE
jgi:CRP/FNR family transcriptional regulator, nitrogen oxide reductase regulator